MDHGKMGEVPFLPLTWHLCEGSWKISFLEGPLVRCPKAQSLLGCCSSCPGKWNQRLEPAVQFLVVFGDTMNIRHHLIGGLVGR